jgi:outer membrane protein OmpA-like peptidoglycan-associated protein
MPFLLFAAAYAFDAHGVSLVPAGDDQQAALTWAPSSGSTGASVGVGLEYAEKPLVQMVDGQRLTVVDDLFVLDLSARWNPLPRLGLAVDVPLYAMGPTDLVDAGGPVLGDVSLWAPVALIPQSGPGDESSQPWSLSLVPGLVLPLGSQDRSLGAAGLSGSALLAVGYSTGRWTLAANLGFARTRVGDAPRVLDAAFRTRALLAVSATLALQDGLALTGEIQARPGTRTDHVEAAPVEAVATISRRLNDTISLRAGGAIPLTYGVGAPQARVLFGLQGTFGGAAPESVLVDPPPPTRLHLSDPQGQPVQAATVVTDGFNATTDSGGDVVLSGFEPGVHPLAVEAAGFLPSTVPVLVLEQGGGTQEFVVDRPRGAVRVRARQATGEPLDARVWFEGPADRDDTSLGDDGSEDLALTDGLWTVWVEADGYGAQARRLHIDGSRKVLQKADFVLLPTAGDAELSVLIVDPDGLSVDGATLSLDGVVIGQSSSGGGIVVHGLAPGPHVLEATGDYFREDPGHRFTLLMGGQEEVLVLRWLPGTVRVITRDIDGEALDAMVAFSGSEDIAPQEVGADGERFYSLTPGDWTVVVSSSSFGVQQRQVQVVSNETSLLAINAVLLESRGNAALSLSVRDEDGQPVRGARVALDGVSLGSTANGGDMWVGGLAAGTLNAEVAGDLYVYDASDITVEGDITEHTVTLEYASGTVELRAVSAEGEPSDALVRASGPTLRPPLTLGDDGRRVVFLEPGDWVVAASSSRLGLVERDIEVQKGQLARVDLTFRADGDAPGPLVDVAAEAVQLLAPVEFETNSAVLLPSSEEILGALAGILLETPSIQKVEVQGYTDSQGPGGANLELSQARAEAVVDWLVDAGVERERLQAQGYGEGQPVASNDTPDGRRRNRRVEVQILQRQVD